MLQRLGRALRVGARVLVLVALVWVVGSNGPSAPARPLVVRTNTMYGSAIGADGLANTQIGGTSCGCPNLLSSFRFRATASASLTSIRLYLITDREGYSSGTGGSVEVALEPDDGSSAHRPSGTTLASAGVPLEPFPRVPFTDAPRLAAGTLYHLVFRNVDPEPTVNFVSLNSLFTNPPPTPRQPAFSDTDWAQLMDYGTGWTLRPEYTPILQLDYGDGSTAGVGYMESWVAAAKVISGDRRVRETFTVAGGSLGVATAGVRLGRVAGSGPLSLTLEDAAGSVLGQAFAAASSIPKIAADAESGAGWTRVTFDQPVVLRDGARYSLVLSSDPSTEYRIHGIRKGSSVGFSPRTFFAEGDAEVSAGSGWVAFDPGWRGPLAEADLQFYLE